MRNSKKISVAVLGLWHLGLTVSVCLAKSGYQVFGFDFDKNNIDKLNLNQLPIFEPNLTEYFKKYLNKNLLITSNLKEVIKNKDYIFITFDTPVNEKDEISLTQLNKLFNLVIKYSSNQTIVILSQIPVGASRLFLKRLKSPKVIYFPENLRLGSAMDDFLKPERIVLGADNQDIIDQFLKDFPIFKCQILKMSLESAEMVKHALNSYLALNISFSSELSDLCELVGANMNEVVNGLKSDPRVSPKAPLNPGLGFAGGTLGRDVKTLIKLSVKLDYSAKLLNAIYQVNQDRLKKLLQKIKKIQPKLSGKTVGILGLTYKPNTDTLRRSQSLELANMLDREKAKVRGFDPAIKNLNLKSVTLINSVEEFLKNLDLLILMTEWPQFRNINPKQAATLMRQKIIVDTKNFLDQKKYENFGFTYLGIGQSK